MSQDSLSTSLQIFENLTPRNGNENGESSHENGHESNHEIGHENDHEMDENGNTDITTNFDVSLSGRLQLVAAHPNLSEGLSALISWLKVKNDEKEEGYGKFENIHF